MLSQLFKAELLRYCAAFPFNIHVPLSPPIRQKAMIVSFTGVFIVNVVCGSIFKCTKPLWKAPLLKERGQWYHCCTHLDFHKPAVPGGAPLPSDAEIGSWCRCPGLLVAVLCMLQGTPCTCQKAGFCQTIFALGKGTTEQ